MELWGRYMRMRGRWAPKHRDGIWQGGQTPQAKHHLFRNGFWEQQKQQCSDSTWMWELTGPACYPMMPCRWEQHRDAMVWDLSGLSIQIQDRKMTHSQHKWIQSAHILHGCKKCKWSNTLWQDKTPTYKNTAALSYHADSWTQNKHENKKRDLSHEPIISNHGVMEALGVINLKRCCADRFVQGIKVPKEWFEQE